MTTSLGALGALTGLAAACGMLLIVSALRRRRPTLEERLAPYVHEQPATSGLLGAHAPDVDGRPGSPGSTVSSVLLATIGSAGYVLEGLGSSAESVRHRLARAGNALTYEQLRLQQLLWAASAFAFTIGAGLLASMVRHVSVPLLAVSALVALISGAALPRLVAQPRGRAPTTAYRDPAARRRGAAGPRRRGRAGARGRH